MNINDSISYVLYIFSFLDCKMLKNFLFSKIFLKDDCSKTRHNILMCLHNNNYSARVTVVKVTVGDNIFMCTDTGSRDSGGREVFRSRGRRTVRARPRGHCHADKSAVPDIHDEGRIRCTGPDPRRSARPEARTRHGHM